MSKLSLVVSRETMEDINRQGLRVPKDAVQKGTGDNTTFSWTELIAITDATVEAPEKEPDIMLFTVKYKVPDDSPFPTNIGEMQTIRFRVWPEAVANPKHEKAGITKLNMRDMTALLRACNFPVAGGEDLVPYFEKPQGGTQAPVVGFRVYCRVVDKPGEDRDGNPTRFQNYSKFLPEDSA